jgi:molybdopterin-guanine dinucleotide biosynthesis protein A
VSNIARVETVPDAAARRRDLESPAAATTGREERAGRGPAIALALVAIAAFAVYSVLAIAVDVPRVHPDEVRYLIAASSLVEGEGLTLRGGEYGFGPLLALVLACILWVAGSVDVA